MITIVAPNHVETWTKYTKTGEIWVSCMRTTSTQMNLYSKFKLAQYFLLKQLRSGESNYSRDLELSIELD